MDGRVGDGARATAARAPRRRALRTPDPRMTRGCLYGTHHLRRVLARTPPGWRRCACTGGPSHNRPAARYWARGEHGQATGFAAAARGLHCARWSPGRPTPAPRPARGRARLLWHVSRPSVGPAEGARGGPCRLVRLARCRWRPAARPQVRDRAPQLLGPQHSADRGNAREVRRIRERPGALGADRCSNRFAPLPRPLPLPRPSPGVCTTTGWQFDSKSLRKTTRLRGCVSSWGSSALRRRRPKQ